MVTQEVELPLSPTALLTRCAAQPYVFALDGGSTASWGTGRALLGFRPRATLQVDADGSGRIICDGATRRCAGDPFVLLERFRAEWTPPAAGTAGWAGGVLAALGYDLCHWVERLPRRAADDRGLPVLHAAAYDWVLSYAYASRRYQLSSASYSAAQLRQVAAELEALAAAPPPAAAHAGGCPVPDLTGAEYAARVQAVLRYIAAGDVYQVNLAQRFVVAPAPAPVRLFAALQHAHAMPFAAYVDGGDFVLVSNSPECFLMREGDRVATYPIKGTRRRAAEPRRDAELAGALHRDPKERAEHVMIVDLERNDLGRVCRIGSVRVDALAQVHTFPSLHHMISTVSGELRAGTPLVDLLRATFPGGSITGAPKIRAMEIIDELEPVRRGFYTGALGFVANGGDAVFNLAIRTAVASAGRFTYHAGGGIVADSIPTREYQETLLKAQPFFAALTVPTV